jgi:hypothetical protein
LANISNVALGGKSGSGQQPDQNRFCFHTFQNALAAKLKQ